MGLDQHSEPIEITRAAACAGDPAAQFHLAVHLEREDNPAEAATWYQQAAERGLAQAQFNLGFLYYTGRGVSVDVEKAAALYRRAADQNLADAQVNLGLLYEYGRGVVTDHVEAARLYALAAAANDANGQYLLGVAYQRGAGVSKNRSEAFRLYELAAQQGLPAAQYRLAYSYGRRWYRPRDVVKAIQLLREAERDPSIRRLISRSANTSALSAIAILVLASIGWWLVSRL